MSLSVATMAATKPSDYVTLHEGPGNGPEIDTVDYLPVAEDELGYTEMQSNVKPQPPHGKQNSGLDMPNFFIPVHQRQPSQTTQTSRQSSEAGRFDMPEYMNAAKDGNKSDTAHCPGPDLLQHQNNLGGETSLNPTYGNLAPGDDLPLPPPPNVTEENELPLYSGINKATPAPVPAPVPAPSTPISVVKKERTLKAADSAIYNHQRIQSTKSYTNGSASGAPLLSSGSNTWTSGDYRQGKTFARTLFCLLFVLFIMCAVAIGLSVYLLLNWPTDVKCTECADLLAQQATSLVATPTTLPPNPVASPPTTRPQGNDSLAIMAVEGMNALQTRLDNLERMVVRDSVYQSDMADLNRKIVLINDYRRDMDMLSLRMNTTGATLASHRSSLRDFSLYRNTTRTVLDSLATSVKDVYENFTEVTHGFNKVFHESRIFKNCSTFERQCGGLSAPANKADYTTVSRCSLLMVPARKVNLELVSVTCEADHEAVVATLRRGQDEGRGESYSCSCYIPKELHDGRLSNRKCILSMHYCEVAHFDLP